MSEIVLKIELEEDHDSAIAMLSQIDRFKSKMRAVLHIFRYPHKTDTIVFTTICIIIQAKCHLSSSIIGEGSLFGYVVYVLADAHCQQGVSAEKN